MHLFLILINPAFAGLDSTREAAFQAALNRYGNGSPAASPSTTPPATPPKTAPPRKTPISESQSSGEEHDIRIGRDSLRIDEDFFWDTSTAYDDEVLSVRDSYTLWKSVNRLGVHFGESLSKTVSHTLNEIPGQHIVIFSNVSASQSETRPDSLFAQHQYESEFDGTKITYIGNIQYIESFLASVDSTVSILRTIDFDPCLLNHGASLTLKYAQEELTAQGKYDVQANCMITKDLEGNFNASLIFTHENGELLKQINLSGELSLAVSKALSIKYSSKYIKGRDPLGGGSSFTGLSFGSDSPSSFIPRGSIPIGSFFFQRRNLENDEGKLNKFTIEQTSDPDQRCVITKSVDLGYLENSDSSEPIYSVNFSKVCSDKETEEELQEAATNADIAAAFEKLGMTPPETSTEPEEKPFQPTTKTTFSFGNDLSYRGVTTPHLSFGRSVTNEFNHTGFDFDVAYLEPNALYTARGPVAEFSFYSNSIYENGTRGERAVTVFYSSSESYVVAEQVFIFPVLTPQNALKLQIPNATRDGSTPKALAGLRDQDLCEKINCFELGIGLSVNNEGGGFLTGRLKTAVVEDIELEVIAGIPLNDRGVNRSWGRVPDYSSFTGLPSTANREAFYEFNLSSSDCDNTKQFCSQLKFRQEGKDKKLQFGGIMEF